MEATMDLSKIESTLLNLLAETGEHKTLTALNTQQLDAMTKHLEKLNGRVGRNEESTSSINSVISELRAEARGAWKVISVVSAAIGGGAAWLVKHLLPVLLLSLTAQAGLVQVTDTLYTVTGEVFTGDIYVTLNDPGRSQPLYNDEGDSLTGWQTKLAVTDGTVSLQIEANDTITPGGTSYTARYVPRRGGPYFETWIVATSGTPIKVYQMRSTTVPSVLSRFTLTQITQSSATTGYYPRWSGTAWVASILRLPGATPASSSATCAAGTTVYDATYLYVCVATDSWKRLTLSSF